MRRLPKTHKKLSMRKQDEPNFYEMDKTSPLPQLQENPVSMLAMRRQAMARAAAINAVPMPPGSGLGSMNPALASVARFPTAGVASYPGSLSGPLLNRPTAESLAGMEAASVRLAAMERTSGARLPHTMDQPSLVASLPSASMSLPPSAASLPLRRSGLGMQPPPAPHQPTHPLDLANPLAAENYQYQRMRHLQHLQLFQRQMTQGGPPPTEEELLRLQAYGGAFGRGRPPYY